jgi:hypothetical protein
VYPIAQRSSASIGNNSQRTTNVTVAGRKNLREKTMGRVGKDYGSEYHFLHAHHEHREDLDRAILSVVDRPKAALEWVYPNEARDGKEPQGLSFLTDRPDVRAEWANFWPTRGRQLSWDGVARLVERDRQSEWLLFEAKANQSEFCTPASTASKAGGKTQIEKALNVTKRRLGVYRFFDWMGSYYQYANRLAVLYFLTEKVNPVVPAHLVFVYFVGDKFPDGCRCPANQTEWEELIRARQLTLGLPTEHALKDQIHDLILWVDAENDERTTAQTERRGSTALLRETGNPYAITGSVHDRSII